MEFHKAWSNFWRRLGRKLGVPDRFASSREETESGPEENRTKVVMLQIDGLGLKNFNQALAEGRLSFLKSLLRAPDSSLSPMYSGLPSTTPAVQSELFHGRAGAVPAFEYVKRESGEACIFFKPECARELSRDLESQAPGLLRGGSSYGNIITGGASEARYDTELINPEKLLKSPVDLRFFFLVLLNLGKILRVVALALLELALALFDFAAGVFDRRDLFKELKFVPMRIGVCIVLRELVRFNVKRDLARGLPIIQANFLGYDEQAHRRGPSSAFAHWTLKGIDGVIRDICRTARRLNPDCLLVVYSDHGQEDAAPYPVLTGREIKESIAAVLSETPFPPRSEARKKGPEKWTLQQRNRHFFSKADRTPGSQQNSLDPAKVKIAASGPLGHVYLPDRIPPAELKDLAGRLVDRAEIPLVLFQDQGRTKGVNRRGVFDLIEDPQEILGQDHYDPVGTAADLAKLCAKKDSGDLVISGWNPDGRPVTFPVENGSHGGPGSEETRAFVLTRPAIEFDNERPRPGELRAKILERLSQADPSPGREVPDA